MVICSRQNPRLLKKNNKFLHSEILNTGNDPQKSGTALQTQMVQIFTISGRTNKFLCISGKIAVNGSVFDQNSQLFEAEKNRFET